MNKFPRTFLFGAIVFGVAVGVCGEMLSKDALMRWDKFKSAVFESSKDSVSQQANFPIKANDLGGFVNSDKELKQRFDKIFEPWVKACFKDATPEPADEKTGFIVNCNGYLFGFKYINGDYKFSYIENINE